MGLQVCTWVRAQPYTRVDGHKNGLEHDPFIFKQEDA
jgi:hypothetical protein